MIFMQKMYIKFNDAEQVRNFINRIDKEGIVWYDDIKELKSVFPGMYKELTEDGFKSVVVCPL